MTLALLSVRFVCRRYRSGDGFEAGTSPKLIRLRSGVEDEVKNVDSGLSFFPPSTESSVPSVYWPVLDDAFEFETELVDAVDADDEGA